MHINGIKGIFMESFYHSRSQKMKLNKVVDLRLMNYKTWGYLRVLSWDPKVFIEINKYIFTVVMCKTLSMQS